MTIRKGVSSDIDEIEGLYNQLIDYLLMNVNYPGWKKDIYPIRQDAEDGVNENALYVVVDDDQIVGTFILRQRPEPAYDTVNWNNSLSYKTIYVIYTLAVHPESLGKNIGDMMMDFIIDEARRKEMKAVRLDVYEGNTPAIHLYEKHRFQYIDTIDLGYSQYGLNWFRLYQYVID
ncbi:MAG TPA: GNAT family N-acetyltransferase [Lachnospiraceae bacterium]|nr:GNAT family N-acetyltransferase [Lachnospiraceae bacterium]